MKDMVDHSHSSGSGSGLPLLVRNFYLIYQFNNKVKPCLFVFVFLIRFKEQWPSS
jgi:hypothetical protein